MDLYFLEDKMFLCLNLPRPKPWCSHEIKHFSSSNCNKGAVETCLCCIGDIIMCGVRGSEETTLMVVLVGGRVLDLADLALLSCD